jgi:hypothetical protein
MKRDELIDQILYARTSQELDAAEDTALKWLRAHPDAVGVSMACEQLAMMRQAVRETE